MSTSPTPSSPKAASVNVNGSIDSKLSDAAKAPATASPAGEQKLSGKELKAQKAAEKAARRAQKKPDGPPAQVQEHTSKPQKKDQKPQQSKPGKPNAVAGPTVASNPTNVPYRQRRLSAGIQEKPAAKPKARAKLQVPLFGHLVQQRRYGIEGSSKDVHPAILSLGLQMSRYEVCGSNARVVAMLLAFKAVLLSYTAPQGHSLSRHFTPHELSPQIEYLKQCRPISVSMGNAIRWLKDVIAKIDPSLDEETAKRDLYDDIDSFIRERITAADELIADNASQKIADGDTIMVYGKSSIVLKTLKRARAKGKNFKIIVVDSKPLFEGKFMARDLAAAGFQEIEYSLLAGISHCKATKAILGAHAMMSNGRLFSRCGTALVAMTARKQDIPVMVCCESIKFADRAPLDSILLNETAQPLELLPDANNTKIWEENINLHILNLMYDVTPAEYVTAIYTEYGVLPPSSVPAVLRLIEDVSTQGT